MADFGLAITSAYLRMAAVINAVPPDQTTLSVDQRREFEVFPELLDVVGISLVFKYGVPGFDATKRVLREVLAANRDCGFLAERRARELIAKFDEVAADALRRRPNS